MDSRMLPCLEVHGPWVVITRVISSPIGLITIVTILITPLPMTPPSGVHKAETGTDGTEPKP